MQEQEIVKLGQSVVDATAHSPSFAVYLVILTALLIAGAAVVGFAAVAYQLAKRANKT